MSLLIAWIFYPLVLLALCLGLGVLLDGLSGRRLPGTLIVPAGLLPLALGGLAIGLSEDAKGFVVPMIWALATLGLGFAIPWKRGPVDSGPVSLALVAYAVVAVPMILVGKPANGGLELELSWAYQPSIAFVAANLALCLWSFHRALSGGTQSQAIEALLLAAFSVVALVPGLLAYRDLGIEAYDRLADLERIGEVFSNQAPALLGEKNAFGAQRALGNLETSMAGTVDIDQIEPGLEQGLEQLFEHPVIILRRPPSSSRPPSPYKRVWSGESYEVWQRPAEPEGPVLHHMPLGDDGAIAGMPDCGEVGGLGLLALSNQLGYLAEDVRLIAIATDGSTMIALPNATDPLCAGPWDWIEAIGVIE
jgi:hypothetical protein